MKANYEHERAVFNDKGSSDLGTNLIELHFQFRSLSKSPTLHLTPALGNIIKTHEK